MLSDWLREWGEYSEPIIQRSQPETKQSRITFDTQLKIARRLLCYVK